MNSYPFFVKRDIDGFFGLFIDNLIQIMLIVTFCTKLLGMEDKFVYSVILPGAAISILVGNIFYAFQARRLAQKTKREDVTALPYGINTVSLIAYVFFIMLPVYNQTKDVYFTWQIGLVACFLSGVIEFLGAFVGVYLRKVTPRAALLSTLASIALTFIAMDFVFKTFQNPIIALLPFAIMLTQYISKVRYPLGLPAGFLAVVVGTIIAWTTGFVKFSGFDFSQVGLLLPKLSTGSLFSVLKEGTVWQYISIIIPMGLFNVVGSLQNLESAEAAGDKYSNFSSLAVNGIGTIVASFLGSMFPTTIYIGHPGWKALGARSGYSVLNGLVICVICLTGTASFILKLIPLEAGICILLWIGIIIVAQAFQEVPKAHATAVAIGLLPALGAWALMIMQNAFSAVGANLESLTTKAQESLSLSGVISLSQGFIFSSMILAAISVMLIERHFLIAFFWALVACFLSYFGIIHAYKISQNAVLNNFGINTAGDFAISYLAVAILFLLMHFWVKWLKKKEMLDK
jgi:AGZA family xanthine/uracil permease-like MFS transporter